MKRISKIFAAFCLFGIPVFLDTVSARTVPAGSPNIYVTASGALIYSSGSGWNVTLAANNAYGLSYYDGKFVWFDRTASQFKYVTPSAMTSVKQFPSKIWIPTDPAPTFLPRGNAQMTPTGWVYMDANSNYLKFWPNYKPGYSEITTIYLRDYITLPTAVGVKIVNYKVGANGNYYFAFTNTNEAHYSDLEGFVCEFDPEPFGVVACYTVGNVRPLLDSSLSGFEFMGMVDENGDSVYDGTFYIEKSHTGYVYMRDGAVVYSGNNDHFANARGIDIRGINDVRFYTPFDPEGYNASAGIAYVGEYKLDIVTGVVTYIGRYATYAYQTSWFTPDTNQYWYYDNQYVNVGANSAADPFGSVGGGTPGSAGNGSGQNRMTGSLSFSVEDQVCAPKSFSGVVSTAYVFSGALAADFSASSVNGIYNNTGSTQALLNYGTGTSTDVGWSQPQAFLGVSAQGTLSNELGIFGSGRFQANGPVVIKYLSANGSTESGGLSFGADLSSWSATAWTNLLNARYSSTSGGRSESGNIGGYFYPSSNPYQYVESAGDAVERSITWKIPVSSGATVTEATVSISAYDPIARWMKTQWSTDNATWHDLVFSGNGFVTTAWTLSPESANVYVRVYKGAVAGSLNIARFVVTYKTRLATAPESGPFDPKGFRIDNTAVQTSACGDLDVQYSYFRDDGQKATGSFSMGANGKKEQTLPSAKKDFTLSVSSSNGAVCIDKLEVISGGVIAQSSYSGDVTRHDCHTEQYSCEWRTSLDCWPVESCIAAWDYCYVNSDLVGSTLTGSFSLSYDSSLPGDYNAVDFDGNATGGLSYSSGTGSYGALVPSGRSSITGTGCLLFSTGSGAPHFLYTYSRGATLSYNANGISDNSVVREFLGYFQKIVDVFLSPANDMLSLARSVWPIPDHSSVCLFGSAYRIDYQSAFFMTGWTALPAVIKRFQPAPGEWTIFDYLFLFLAVFALAVPTYRVLKSLKTSE